MPHNLRDMVSRGYHRWDGKPYISREDDKIHRGGQKKTGVALTSNVVVEVVSTRLSHLPQPVSITHLGQTTVCTWDALHELPVVDEYMKGTEVLDNRERFVTE